MRDRLVELIQSAVDGCARYWAEIIADHLIADGWMRLPCKVGDTVYCIFEGEIRELKVISYSFLISSTIKHSNIHTTNSRGAVLSYEQCDIGKTIFLTKEDAEQKLKEMRGEKDA